MLAVAANYCWCVELPSDGLACSAAAVAVWQDDGHSGGAGGSCHSIPPAEAAQCAGQQVRARGSGPPGSVGSGALAWASPTVYRRPSLVACWVRTTRQLLLVQPR